MAEVHVIARAVARSGKGNQLRELLQRDVGSHPGRIWM